MENFALKLLLLPSESCFINYKVFMSLRLDYLCYLDDIFQYLSGEIQERGQTGSVVTEQGEKVSSLRSVDLGWI